MYLVPRTEYLAPTLPAQELLRSKHLEAYFLIRLGRPWIEQKNLQFEKGSLITVHLCMWSPHVEME